MHLPILAWRLVACLVYFFSLTSGLKSLSHLIFRRGLVELFDLLQKGELMEGPKFSSLVTEMHKNRWFDLCHMYSSVSRFKDWTEIVFLCFQARSSKEEIWLLAREQGQSTSKDRGILLWKPISRVHLPEWKALMWWCRFATFILLYDIIF